MDQHLVQQSVHHLKELHSTGTTFLEGLNYRYDRGCVAMSFATPIIELILPIATHSFVVSYATIL